MANSRSRVRWKEGAHVGTRAFVHSCGLKNHLVIGWPKTWTIIIAISQISQLYFGQPQTNTMIPFWKDTVTPLLSIVVDGVLYTEEWKDIEGYEGLYQISSFGRVKSLERVCAYKKASFGKPFYMTKPSAILRPTTVNGYLKVRLSINASHKMFRVHRLVATAFIPNPGNLPDVNHKKGVKTDNMFWELEWAARKENVQHSWRTGLSKKQVNTKKSSEWSFSKSVAQYDRSGCLVKKWDSISDAAKGIKGDVGNICKAASGKMKSAYGFLWRYPNP